MSEYDISRAFKRIENDLMDSMMRNLKRHQAEETDLGIEWEQWQALQLKELERYRKQNADKFTDDFDQINRKVDAMFRATCNDAQSKQENYLLNQIKKGDFTPTQTKDTQFFNLNDAKLNILIERTKADFTRAEYAMLRKADDAYRKVIFDAQVYANVTNDYAKAVDMATHDFLMKGIQCVQYSNGAKHTLENYAEMCVRTGNKRAYLMGEGNAHDKYGIHTVRVNKRTQACPKCVKFLGRVLIDDVYSGGTAKEASDLGVPTLSSAIQAGFLHPNCKDIYSLYIPDVSKPATPWTQQEINDIVGDYNQEQELKHAQDMADSYLRLAKYALSPDNKALYQARADNWQNRITELQGTTPQPIQPVAPAQPIAQVFTDEQKEALEWYVSGDGMWINQYLRDPSAFGELNDTEKELLALLDSATKKELPPIDTLYRSVDAKVIFEGLDEAEIEQMMNHLFYGDSTYDKGAFSQRIKKRMEKALSDAKGKTLTEKGLMSTTVDKKIAEEFGDFTGAEHPVVIELDTKGKKIKGADVDFLDIKDAPQRERILARNTRYKINDIVVETDADGAKYIKVKAELVDQAENVASQATAPTPVAPTINVESKAVKRQILNSDIEEINKRIASKQDELDKAKQVLAERESLFKWYERSRAEADQKGIAITEVIEQYKERAQMLMEIDESLGKGTIDRYNKILENLDSFESGAYIKDQEKEIKRIQKEARSIKSELKKKEKELEDLLGTPKLVESAISQRAQMRGIKKQAVKYSAKELTEEEIIKTISGGDKTKGSCASLAFTYAGRKAGYDVYDFRGGKSREFFSRRMMKIEMMNDWGVDGFIEYATDDVKAVNTLMAKATTDKEYMVCTGCHSAILKKDASGKLWYLELQHPVESKNGWHELTDEKLISRFACKQFRFTDTPNVLLDVESMSNNDKFADMLQYINTTAKAQKKGMSGNVR